MKLIGTEIFAGIANGSIVPTVQRFADVWCSMKTDGEEHNYYGKLVEENVTTTNTQSTPLPIPPFTCSKCGEGYNCLSGHKCR